MEDVAIRAMVAVLASDCNILAAIEQLATAQLDALRSLRERNEYTRTMLEKLLPPSEDEA